MSNDDTPSEISPKDLAICRRVLERLVEDPEQGQGTDLLPLIAKVSKRDRRERRRKSGSARKKKDRAAHRQAAEQLQQHREDGLVDREALASAPPVPLVWKSRECYGCQGEVRVLQAQYPWFCAACAKQNLDKRDAIPDLQGRTVLLTGGRIKIGFQTALRALRGGARVHVTTRFPRNALSRYSREADFSDWQDRLVLHGLDFRDLRGLLAWCDWFAANVPELNVIINQAAQSVKRSADWHARLAAFERDAKLPANLQSLIAHEAGRGPARLTAESVDASALALLTATELVDANDRDDRRETNSWTMQLGEVPPVELLEVLLVNANAPALILAHLRPLLARSTFSDRYVINVTGTDGMLSLTKSGKHPHVNMSKAALNMITRTSAEEFLDDSIYMNSVDTGWITYEAGYTSRQDCEANSFIPPLDEIDGAARILDPIQWGLEGRPEWGGCFRNFEVRPW